MAYYPPITSGVVENFTINSNDQETLYRELSLVDFYLKESLLSPSVQMSCQFTDPTHIVKNYMSYKFNGTMPPNITCTLVNPILNKSLNVRLHVYRMDSRSPINYNTERFTLHSCDLTTFINMKRRMSDYYRDVELSKIVSDALNAAGADSTAIGKSKLSRSYMTNNQHPFQVISDISDMATDDVKSPFLHYMTMENKSGRDSTGTGGGKHYWKSLKELINQKEMHEFSYNEKGVNEQLTDPNNIMLYEFPCDFDTLLDLSSGIAINEEDYKNHRPSMVSLNPFDSGFYLVAGKSHDKTRGGFGGILNAGAWSNLNTQDDVPTRTERYLHKRSEMLSCLHRENINLKIVVPFNPEVHVGQNIKVKFEIKRDDELRVDYGSGKYLVAHLTHNIKTGGYGTTTLECIKIDTAAGSPADPRLNHQKINTLLNM